MSGVIDERGQQWETCTAHETKVLIKFPDLMFDLVPVPGHPHGGTICVECVLRLRAQGVRLKDIRPLVPENWKLASVPRPDKTEAEAAAQVARTLGGPRPYRGK